MSKYRLAAYHLAQAVSVLLSAEDLRSKVKYLSRDQLVTMSSEEICEYFGEDFGGRKTVAY